MFCQIFRPMRKLRSIWQNLSSQKRSFARIYRNQVTAEMIRNQDCTFTLHKWDVPEKNFYKFNVDGGFDPTTKEGTSAGILRNWDGEVKAYLQYNIPRPISQCAVSEFYALEMAVRIIKDRGFNMETVFFESDSEEVCHTVNKLKMDILVSNAIKLAMYQMGAAILPEYLSEMNRETEITVEKLAISTAFYRDVLLCSLSAALGPITQLAPKEILVSDDATQLAMYQMGAANLPEYLSEMNRETEITVEKLAISTAFYRDVLLCSLSAALGPITQLAPKEILVSDDATQLAMYQMGAAILPEYLSEMNRETEITVEKLAISTAFYRDVLLCSLSAALGPITQLAPKEILVSDDATQLAMYQMGAANLPEYLSEMNRETEITVEKLAISTAFYRDVLLCSLSAALGPITQLAPKEILVSDDATQLAMYQMGAAILPEYLSEMNRETEITVEKLAISTAFYRDVLLCSLSAALGPITQLAPKEILVSDDATQLAMYQMGAANLPEYLSEMNRETEITVEKLAISTAFYRDVLLCSLSAALGPITQLAPKEILVSDDATQLAMYQMGAAILPEYLSEMNRETEITVEKLAISTAFYRDVLLCSLSAALGPITQLAPKEILVSDDATQLAMYQMGAAILPEYLSEMNRETEIISTAFYWDVLLCSLSAALGPITQLAPKDRTQKIVSHQKVVAVPENQNEIDDKEFDKEFIISRISSLISDRFQINYIVRECNAMADVLAAEAKKLPKGTKVIVWTNEENEGLGENELKVLNDEDIQKVRFNLE
ncbi:hypothetical protein CASFOL_001374 [Castilleja foliolosa]|uniref:RNase H type-1 domain-containing protein n=1 Tax=Castilleja foliolosa TaxID=1961234 RepID=A0ABD3EME5_9LAMI